MADLELTPREIVDLAMLATLANPDPRHTDAALMAVYYKAKAAVDDNGDRVTFSGALRIRKGS